MAGWSLFTREAPELAERAAGYLAGGRHKTLATLRRDGSPRISGIETIVAEGELWIGMMWLSHKARDLRRDPRLALHSASPSPPAWTGDAKLAALAVEVDDPAVIERVFATFPEPPPPGPAHLFRLDLTEVATVCLGDPPDHLVTELWRPGASVVRSTRS